MMRMHRAYWIQDGALYKKARYSKHFFRVAGAWGVDEETLNEARSLGVKEVVIIDEETGTYRAPVSEFDRHGFKLDLGHGSQVFLRLKYWNTETYTTSRPPKNAPGVPKAPGAVQEALL